MPTVILTAILRECQNSDLHTAYPAYRSLRIAIRISRCLKHGEADLAVNPSFKHDFRDTDHLSAARGFQLLGQALQ
jgi:hypothetical protein